MKDRRKKKGWKNVRKEKERRNEDEGIKGRVGMTRDGKKGKEGMKRSKQGRTKRKKRKEGRKGNNTNQVLNKLLFFLSNSPQTIRPTPSIILFVC